MEETEDAFYSIYTDEFCELLDYTITKCENYGITVDLNMESGWNANSQYVELEYSMGNMALGRSTVTGTEVSEIKIPSAQKCIFY